MPLKWDNDPRGAPVAADAYRYDAGDRPLAHAVLWPHRSLPRRGMVWVIGFAFVMIMIPALPLLGTPALWGLLPFTLGAVWLFWFLLERSYDSAKVREDLTVWSDRIEILHRDTRGTDKHWVANPFWVRLSIKEKGGPVSQYLTLTGAGRAVELGAFLSPDERESLYDDLDRLLHRLSR